VLFDNLTLSFGRERTGLIGRNGVGKTTLLRLILGELTPAAGAVSVAGRVATLRQALSPPAGWTLADLLGIPEPLPQLAPVEAGQGWGTDLDTADWALPQRADAALAEMGLGGVALGRPAASLSGGEATRAALAALLIAEPDLVLMDEPTNNLDIAGRRAVTEMLERWRGGALGGSHDRAVVRRLDRVGEPHRVGAKGLWGGVDPPPTRPGG